MTERDGIIADAWNDYVTERDKREWKVSLRIDLDVYITGDKDIDDDEIMDKILETLNYDKVFRGSDVKILDMYQI